jgi:peptidoglycan hydrolase-like protein with peptidoglycan-binding domain
MAAGGASCTAYWRSMGYDVGEPDRDIGTKTKEAIADFQGKNGMPVNGRASVTALEALRRSSRPNTPTRSAYQAAIG